MTALKMKVAGWGCAFVGVLCLAALLGWAMVFVVGSNAGGLYQGLGLLNLSDESIAPLPGGAMLSSFLSNPSFRAFTASAIAGALPLVECLAVIASFRLLQAWSRAQGKTFRAVCREHVALAVMATCLVGVVACIMTLELGLWVARAHADVALGALGRKAAWFAGDNGVGESVAESAHRLTPWGALAFFAAPVGLAFGVELVGYLLMYTGTHLAEAVDSLKKIRLGDLWLDAVEVVVATGSRREFVSRRTALANPTKFYLDSRGRVFATELVDQLRAIDLAKVAAVVIVMMLGVSSTQAAEPNVMRAAYEPPALYMTVFLDNSKGTEKTAAQRVSVARSMFREIADTVDEDVRHARTARVAISLESIDSFGGETLWRGSELTVGELTDAWWANTIASRKSYGGCSEFGEAWKKFEHFSAAARSCDRIYLVALTDFVVESKDPRTTRCRPKVYGPPAEVPWPALKRATTLAYFIPDVVKLAWEAPLRAQALTGQFKMYAGPDPSGRVPLPLRELLATTACAPDAAAQAATVSGIKHVGLIVLGAVAVVVAALFVVARA